jgi:hypothetical protein
LQSIKEYAEIVLLFFKSFMILHNAVLHLPYINFHLLYFSVMVG